MEEKKAIKSKQTAYCYWAFGLFGCLGLHRLYMCKRKTGYLWLFSLGCIGIGSLIDLLLIPKWVNRHNAIIELGKLKSDLNKLQQLKQIVVNAKNFESAAWYRDKEKLLQEKIELLQSKT
ncbi:MAG: TM2 domain-containing protein [Flavobacterium sp.]|nr:TM2 domain-containing protein [Flavobacterium sp.]